MRYYVTIGGHAFEVELGPEGARVDGEQVEASLAHTDGSPLRSLLLGTRTHRLVASHPSPGRWKLGLRGSSIEADVVDERARAIREMAGSGTGPAGPASIVAPMPGLVVKVEVQEGDLVQAGQGVAIVEAMKMENELRASAPGRVTRVRVRKGDAVEKDQVLVDLAPLEEAAP